MSDIAMDIEAGVKEENMVDAKGQHIILLEDSVGVMIGDDVSQIEKRITYEDFHSIISTILNRRNEESMEGFQLPSNCFYFAKSANSIQLSCYYGERIAEMKHLGDKYMVKTPNFIISHNLEKQTGKSWKSTNSKYFCTNSKVGALPKGFIWAPNGNQKIYLSPFPNTYAEGNMCYGGNQMPVQHQDNNLAGLNWYYQFLFESPFNNDLGLRALKEEIDATSWFTKLKEVATKNEPFPYDLLRGYRAA